MLMIVGKKQITNNTNDEDKQKTKYQEKQYNV